jgi:hypothetical protein
MTWHTSTTNRTTTKSTGAHTMNTHHDAREDGQLVTPAEWAGRAAEAVRGLNHAGIVPDAWAWPADLYDTIGALATLVQRLPQAFDQAARWLDDAHEAGKVGHDRGPALTHGAVSSALDLLAVAGADARSLADALSEAHAQTSHLTGIRPADRAATVRTIGGAR